MALVHLIEEKLFFGILMIDFALMLVIVKQRSQNLLINLSGRGDKDIFTIAEALKDASWQQFLVQKARQHP